MTYQAITGGVTADTYRLSIELNSQPIQQFLKRIIGSDLQIQMDILLSKPVQTQNFEVMNGIRDEIISCPIMDQRTILKKNNFGPERVDLVHRRMKFRGRHQTRNTAPCYCPAIISGERHQEIGLVKFHKCTIPKECKRTTDDESPQTCYLVSHWACSIEKHLHTVRLYNGIQECRASGILRQLNTYHATARLWIEEGKRYSRSLWRKLISFWIFLAETSWLWKQGQVYLSSPSPR